MNARAESKAEKLLGITVWITLILFVLVSIIGNYGPNLMENGICYRYLGCNTGFFGFDALVHFLSGITEAAVAIWVMYRFPSMSLFTSSFWKDLVILLSLILFFAFLWELSELLGDLYRMLVLHIDLVSKNMLYQPSSKDTMGDMIAAFVGGLLIALPFLRIAVKKTHTR